MLLAPPFMNGVTCGMAYLCVCGQYDCLVIRLVQPAHQLGQEPAAGDARRTPDSSDTSKAHSLCWECHACHTVVPNTRLPQHPSAQPVLVRGRSMLHPVLLEVKCIVASETGRRVCDFAASCCLHWLQTVDFRSRLWLGQWPVWLTASLAVCAPEASLLLDRLPHLSRNHSTQLEPQLTSRQPRWGVCYRCNGSWMTLHGLCFLLLILLLALLCLLLLHNAQVHGSVSAV